MPLCRQTLRRSRAALALRAAPACAEGNRPAPCDHSTLEACPRTAQWRTFEGRFDHRSEGLFLSCGKVLKRSGSLQILGGLSVMSFINSYQHQSDGLGASLEVQDRPPRAKIGAFAGIAAGIIQDEAGFCSRKNTGRAPSRPPPGGNAACATIAPAPR